ncbi:tRNA glutamyl-Q(34) synthetase GluQRS [Adhaeretor mobilis]|uniref:tRNA ligase n=1 Tax=Adhaeretor mobilis TaxID=1930276 RepID=A0A517MPJ2_9BACT|nr:tRNA glutamyl-Q(34) synthetase GluQRS [Adhaeretor mobilis]QDS96803.1 tRNA ligase [Adhaeretor mobilis]
MSRTRLAPSPTGALHLGNARTFLVNWALARQQGWKIVLRIEDLDGPRVKEGAAQQAIDDLQWLGLDWDEGPLYQLAVHTPYEQALEQLAQAGHIYPCRCTRKQIEAAALSAPHGSSHETRYPGTCRPAEPTPTSWLANQSEGTAWRLRVEPGDTQFEDAFAGTQVASVEQSVGDFLVATKVGLPAYQLAVVVDDSRQGIDEVVRGDDLLRSTHRQLLVQRLLEIDNTPRYTHLPLVVGEDGRRLAKRHGDTRLDYYREAGVSPERVVGLLAKWCGVGEQQEMIAAEFADCFRLQSLPRESAVFRATDDEYLRDC